MDEHDSFPQRVWQIVASIPEGYVTTYGDVARLAGSPRAARRVGRAKTPAGRKYVALVSGGESPRGYFVDRAGFTAPASGTALRGVTVSGAGQIDLQKYRWIY